MNSTDQLQRLKIVLFVVLSISLGLVLLINLFYPLSTKSSTSVHIVGSGNMILDILCIIYFVWLASVAFNYIYGFKVSGSQITFLTGISSTKTFQVTDATSISKKGPFPHYKFVFGSKSLFASASHKNISQVISLIHQQNPNIKVSGHGI